MRYLRGKPGNQFLIFSLASLLVMGGVAVLLSYLTSLPLKEAVLNHAAEEASEISDRLVKYLTPEDLVTPMAGQRLTTFDNLVRDIAGPGFPARVKLWNKEARVMYSGVSSQIGVSYPDNDELIKALKGELHKEVVTSKKAENVEESELGTFIEVYVPVYLPGSTEIQGVMEVYELYTPFAELIRRQQRIVFGANLIGLLALYGAIASIAYYIWRQMSRQQLMLDQKSQETTAVGELNVKMLNERATLLEGMEHQKGRLANLCLALTLAEGSPGPLELGQELLSIIQQEVSAEYASLTMVEPNGTLGKRVDRFQGIKPFQVSAHRGGLAESILSTGRTQYVADTNDTRANPSLALGGIRSYIGIAIRAEAQLVGILFLHSTKPDAFREERSFLESLASICALPLQRARLNSYIETAKHELEATFDAIPNGVVLIDEERRVLRANQTFAQMVGWQVEKVVGVTVCKLIHGKDDPFHRCPLDKSLSSAQPDVIVFREPHLGNALLNVRTYPVPAPQGQPRRFMQLFSFSE